MVSALRRHASRALAGSWMLASIACAIASVNAVAGIPYRVAGLELRISADIGLPGRSTLAIPPIGRVEAITHSSPLQLQATLENIDLESLEDAMNSEGAPSSISGQFRRDARRLVACFALEIALLAAAGGALGAGAVSRWRPRRVAGGAALGLALGLIVLAGAYATFDARRLANPRYEGVIEAAPWMLGLLDTSLLGARETLGSIETIADNVRAAFDHAQAFQDLAGEAQYVRLLHVSDIHSDPRAFGLIRQVIQSFQPDLIVDTGDVTDFGTLPEARAAARAIRSLGVPYFFVGGNHDSPDVLRTLQSEGGATLLGEGAAVSSGLRFAGFDDPGALRADMSSGTEEEVARVREAVSACVSAPSGAASGSGSAAAAGTGAGPGSGAPDVLAVHDVRTAEPAIGVAPVVLCGHDHRPSLSQRGATVVIDAGTTGGAGLRGLRVEGGVPLSVALLYFEVGGARDGRPRLVAVDTIRIPGDGQGFSLERRVLAAADAVREASAQAPP